MTTRDHITAVSSPSLLKQLEHALFEPSVAITDIQQRHQMRLLLMLLLILILLGGTSAVMQLIVVPNFMPTFLSITGAILILSVAYVLVRRGYYRIPAALTCLLPSVASFISLVKNPGDTPAFVYLLAGVFLGGVLFDRRWIIGLSALNLAGLFILPTLQPAWTYADVTGSISYHIIIPALFAVAAIHSDRLEQDRRQELAENEFKFRSIYQASGVSIWQEDFSEIKQALDRLRAQGVTDIRSYLDAHPEFVRQTAKMLKVIDVNDATIGLYGAKDKAEFLNALEYILDLGETDSFRDELIAMAENRRYFEGEVKDRTLQGRTIYLWRTIVFPEESSRFKSVLVSLTDITEQKRTEHALRESEALYRSVVSALSEGLVVQDKNDKILMANETAANILKLSMDQLLGRDSFDPRWQATHEDGTPFRPEEHPSMVTLRTGQPVDNTVMIVSVGKDERAIIAINSRPIHDEHGEVTGVVVTFSDITKRKNAENALRESNERLQSIIDNEPECVKVLDLDGRLLAMNPAGLEMIEADSLDQVVGGDVSELVTPEYRFAFQDLTRKVLAGGSHSLTFEIRGLKGSHRWLETHAVPLRDHNGKVNALLGITIDITERKQAEQKLREATESLESIIRFSPVAIISYDVEGRVLTWNPGAENVFGWRPEEVIGQIAPHIGADQVHEFHVLRDRVVHGEALTALELTRVRKDGTPIVIDLSTAPRYDVSGQLTGYIAIITDITERKRSEMALRESEERFSKIFQTSPVGIYIFSLTDQTSVDVNTAFLKIIGYEREELIGHGALELGLFVDSEVYGIAREYLNAGGEVRDWDMKVRHKSGEIRDVLASIEVINLNGKPMGMISALDITERKQAEEDREHLISELTTKNAELEHFTYTVSHDLKSPLVTMKGFLGYLVDDAVNGNIDRLKKDTARIANAVDKMSSLLNDLLELSRIGRFINTPEVVPFASLAQQALEIVSGRIKANNIDVVLEPDLPNVYCDRTRLIEALQNLFDNAAKYMGSQPHPRIEIGQRHGEAGKPIFYVRDNGIGIAPEYHERIFGLFNKLDPRSEGTGVGLALVKRIIEFHGCQIWIESQPGAGATFCFTLPAPPTQPETDSGL